MTTMLDVVSAGDKIGLRTRVSTNGNGLVKVEVKREADDWSLPPRTIAIGHDESIVYGKALGAIRALAAQIERQSAEPEPEPPTPVRISDEDVERIAQRVVELLA